MAYDFAKRKKPRKRKPPPRRFSPGSFLLGVVTGVGLFLLGAYGPELWLDRAPHGAIVETRNPTNDQPASEQADEPTGEPASRETLEFVFRDLLGEDEVDPDVSAYAVDVQPRQSDLPMQYLLQSGSFQIKADAQMRRGALLLLNLPANVVEAQIDNRTWYRVIVGPYSQRGQAQQAASRLQANEIKSIWLERPVEPG